MLCFVVLPTDLRVFRLLDASTHEGNAAVEKYGAHSGHAALAALYSLLWCSWCYREAAFPPTLLTSPRHLLCSTLCLRVLAGSTIVSDKAPCQTLTHFLPSRTNHGLLHAGEGFSGHGTVLEWMSTKLRSPQQCYIPLCILYPSPTAVVLL